MSDPLTTARRETTPENPNFESLRNEAIQLIQQFSGRVWTDYDAHDPGITILEQLIYAITDLIYRADFAVEDYLAAEDGSIDLETQGLHAPADVFACRSTTLLDYRKLLFSEVAEVEKVWITELSDHEPRSEYRGLYRIVVKLVQGLDSEKTADAVEQLRATYHRARNLCEDLDEIHIVERIECELCADIEVSSARPPADILADIYYSCAQRMASSVPTTSHDQLDGDTLPLDQLFDGPCIGHGFFMGDDLGDDLSVDRSRFQVSALYPCINPIEGVVQIQGLHLSRHGEVFYKIIDLTDYAQAFDLLVPRGADEVKVKLMTNGRVLNIQFDEVITRFEELKSRNHSLSSIRQSQALSQEPVKGTARQLGQYFSVQNLFPACYRINKADLPESATNEESARARQLKGYLLIFEQLLANFLANLDSIKTSFSTQTDLRSSYSLQTFNQQETHDLDAVYPENPDQVFGRILARFDNCDERKNRLLDYLLALYGERFSQNALRHFFFYHSKNEIEDVVIANKLAYLQSIIELGRDRAAAPDYYAASDGRRHGGLSSRIAMLLGFERRPTHSLTAALLTHNFGGLESGGDGFRLSSIEELRESGYEHFEQPPLRSPDEHISDAQLRASIVDIIPGDGDPISDVLLVNGIYIERYSICSALAGQDFRLLLRYEDSQWWQLADFADRAAAIDAAHNLRQLLLRLNRDSEGSHIVEHLLLRPHAPTVTPWQGREDNFFSFKISIVFPNWTARCRDPDFRKLAEETLRLNVPAHVLAEVYWFDYAEMTAFEKLYDAWWQSKISRDTEPAELDNSAQCLQEFLLAHHEKSRR